MNKILLSLLLKMILLFVVPTGYAQNVINVLDYGAQNDGVYKNTVAIKAAIEEASSQGGGTVYFPAGDYLTGPIHLKSNITLHIDAGAIVKFSEDFDDYLPMVPTRFQGVNGIGFSPLIYGNNLQNVSIIGMGTIDGQGEVWQKAIKAIRKNKKEGIINEPNKWQKIFAQNNPDKTNLDQSGFQRPLFIQFLNSSRIKIKDIKIVNAPFWTVHFVDCENVAVDGVYIKNPEESSNTDGINPESSRNVKITNCVIDVGDDCIAIKSGKGAEARENYKPSKNIQISNCTMIHGAAGVAIGSEMSAGVEDVVISNCIIENTGKGIHIKTNRERGGSIKNIRVNNIIIRNILYCFDGFPAAIHINAMYYDKDSTQFMPVTKSTPKIENIHFSNISMADIKYPVYLYGLGESNFRNLSFSNFNIKSTDGIHLKNVDGISVSNLFMSTDTDGIIAGEYLKNLNISNLRTRDNARKRIVLSDIDNVEIFYNSDTPRHLKIRGERTGKITLSGDSNDEVYLDVGEEVSEGEVNIR
ncbi:glycoside hydrolase family 28 protein [Sunxiuqinia indica]|uniref:glycoside hydrolase family 28 protein n=1 Tax=Sunxiuqinia indica TaxID=2692584 RepID=UPI001357F007|nr:glycoside hydrolase family 28 protein [Sunxiuqinia indica]